MKITEPSMSPGSANLRPQVSRLVSLRWVVPAISTALLAIVVTVFGTIAYRAVREATLQTAGKRVRTAAEAFSRPTTQVPVWVRQSRAIAATSHIAGIVRSNGLRVSDSARTLLRGMAPDTGQTLAAEVRSPTGAVLFGVVSALADSVQQADANSRVEIRVARGAGMSSSGSRQLMDSMRLARAYRDTLTTSELYVRGTHVLFERAVPILDRGQVVGSLVEVRTVVPASTTALSQLSQLIGENATFVVGNADGSVWTDLSRRIQHPPASLDAQVYERDGRRWIAASAPLATAPWVVSVELQESQVLAPVRALRWRLIGIGAVILLLAIVVTEWLGRRMTIPLTRLTTAAEGIADGDRHTRAIVFQRADEIGRLSRAFAAMTESIRASHDTLEQRIGERTGELRVALDRLRDAQEELLRKERLATLGQLSSSVAHELRNPLGVMTNGLYYLDVVLKDAPPKVREHLARLQAQVRLSESIITGLLDLTRTTVAKPGVVSVIPFIDDQLSRVGLPADIRIERDIDADVPDLWVDPIQIGQVMVNLFTNAMQAMESGGGTLSLRVRPHGPRVRIEVADTGPGIPPEDVSRIFEPLFTTKARGIGLGLWLSRTLAVANGGTLTATNHNGGGALLVLEVPTARAMVSADAADAEAGSNGGPAVWGEGERSPNAAVEAE